MKDSMYERLKDIINYNQSEQENISFFFWADNRAADEPKPAPLCMFHWMSDSALASIKDHILEIERARAMHRDGYEPIKTPKFKSVCRSGDLMDGSVELVPTIDKTRSWRI